MSQEIVEDEDIVLAELSDSELTEQMHDDLYDGLAEEIADAESVGKLVIGTVKGDIHDIGKDFVGMMMEGAGFDVIANRPCH